MIKIAPRSSIIANAVKKNHVIYVWLDALTNYISALNYPNTKEKLFKSFWELGLISRIQASTIDLAAIYFQRTDFHPKDTPRAKIPEQAGRSKQTADFAYSGKQRQQTI